MSFVCEGWAGRSTTTVMDSSKNVPVRKECVDIPYIYLEYKKDRGIGKDISQNHPSPHHHHHLYHQYDDQHGAERCEGRDMGKGGRTNWRSLSQVTNRRAVALFTGWQQLFTKIRPRFMKMSPLFVCKKLKNIQIILLID